MILKKSFYNVEIDKLENKDILFFNSATSAFGIMNKKTQDLCNNTDFINEKLLVNEDDIKNIKIMKENGFLVDKDIDEYTRMDVIGKLQKYNSHYFGLTIAPTINCNMACPYCYEEKTNKRMNNETKSALIKYVKDSIIARGVQFFHVTWYGGEPLLEKELIKELSKEFINITKENNVIYSASIITNGSLLDYETAKMLKESNVSFAQITIDGMKETHNKRRILKNGLDSFKIVTDNIEACKDLINIAIRVNIDKTNVEEARELIEYFINEKKWIDNKIIYYFAPVDKSTDACNADINSCFSAAEFGKIDADLLRLTYQYGNKETIKRLYPTGGVGSCGAVQSTGYVVDPEGYLYKCWDVVGIKANRVGDIFNGAILNNEYLTWLSLELPGECKECNVLPLCQGGCPYLRIRNGNKPTCSHKVYSFKENLKITYQNYIQKKAI